MVPPTFLTTQLFWEKCRSTAPIRWALVEMSDRAGHARRAGVRLPRRAAASAGDRLHRRLSKITEIYDKQSRSGAVLTFIKMVTEFRNEAGELVAESILTGVEKQRAPKEEGQ